MCVIVRVTINLKDKIIHSNMYYVNFKSYLIKYHIFYTSNANHMK